MPRTQRTPEQQLAELQQQEVRLKERRKVAEEKVRQYREHETAKNLANLMKVLKRYGIDRLTPEQLEQRLTSAPQSERTTKGAVI